MTIDGIVTDPSDDLIFIRFGHGEMHARTVTATPTAQFYKYFTDNTDFLIVTPAGVAAMRVVDQDNAWAFPIGTDEYPPARWYAASLHGDRNPRWGGGKHTGVDYNLDVAPWGDVDVGLPVWAVADGTVHGTWYSDANLGSVVIRVEHDGMPLWIRYWHLARSALFLHWQPGMTVTRGQQLGEIGDYPAGGAHLHFDMCVRPFHPGVWWSLTMPPQFSDWPDPAEILRAHLPPAEVDASLARGL